MITFSEITRCYFRNNGWTSTLVRATHRYRLTIIGSTAGLSCGADHERLNWDWIICLQFSRRLIRHRNPPHSHSPYCFKKNTAPASIRRKLSYHIYSVSNPFQVLLTWHPQIIWITFVYRLTRSISCLGILQQLLTSTSLPAPNPSTFILYEV